ncbi:patatin-like phospholipase family protein [Shewanella electrodiphila]|uniref:Patatin-like phospholipase family protein n=1 Tax=Shewanella electrodiphila TaxID=934143 RepID=A0ABT0KNJ8_9GAMM|nr:patatin-like phospholipase family protein [Shewanella electrodiphila]MCL1045426.1 patatin-like phospholipase family protein [Shewanella electrodiphila]
MTKFIVEAWSQGWIDKNNFPEESLKAFQASYANKSLGVAFSGGGTRSAACTLGQLKALHDLNIIDEVKYISAVSGGGWAATPYTFVSSDKMEQYFGRVLEPNDIDSSICKSVIKGSFQECITKAPILMSLVRGGVSGKGDESFAYSLGNIFLKPFKLHNPDTHFTFNEETLKSAQEGLKEGSKNEGFSFDVSRQGTPFLILGATLLNEDGFNSDKKYHIEYTPYYSGSRVSHKDKEFIGQDDYFGGGYITSCGYDCIGPYKKSSVNGVEKLLVKRVPKSLLDFTNERAFSLADIIASTGAAPQEITSNIGLGALGFPEFNHIPISIPKGQNQVAEEYPHSDGGHLENLGIMPLLARKVSKIIVFINTKKAFVPDIDSPLNSSLNKSLKALFLPINNLFGLSKFKTNIVFKNGQKELLKIIKQFTEEVEKESSSGEFIAKNTLVAKSNLVTKSNNFYGIEAGQHVEVTWVYNCRSKAWEDSLGDRELAEVISKKKKLFGTQKGLEDFPHYGTFFENLKGIIVLTPLQTNLLTNLSYWSAKKALTELSN